MVIRNVMIMCHCLCAVFSVSVDYAVCGLAPLGEYLVILLYEEQLTDEVGAVSIFFKFFTKYA